MTLDRAIEILDPEHRERYESIDPVNEACRMGMEALQKIRDGKLVEVVRCCECKYSCPIRNGREEVLGWTCRNQCKETFNLGDGYCAEGVWDGKTGL